MDKDKQVKRLNPLNDFAFKNIMGEKGKSEPLLLSFLNAVLKKTRIEPIISLEILDDKELPAESLHGKASRLDVLARLANNAKVNIEVQLANEHNMSERTLYYWGREFILGIESGENYKEIYPVITINIVNFKHIPLDEFHTSFHIYEDTHKDYMLTNLLEIHFIDMVRFRQKLSVGLDVAEDELYQWLVYMNKNSDDELLRRVLGMNSVLAEVNEKLRTVQNNPALYHAYLGYEKYERDMNNEKSYAREEGERAKALKIAQNLLAFAIPLDVIASSTGLTLAEVKRLQNNINV
ncbi:Rpn family recombination-promoting nuclease/putative transposase [Deferribacterales bacterium RsTz2092]|nr:hypothetical protein AGMMS49941_08000 [Deferribacterales bacterium]